MCDRESEMHVKLWSYKQVYASVLLQTDLSNYYAVNRNVSIILPTYIKLFCIRKDASMFDII